MKILVGGCCDEVAFANLGQLETHSRFRFVSVGLMLMLDDGSDGDDTDAGECR